MMEIGAAGHALSFYDICAAGIENVNDDYDAHKVTDCAGARYFLKIYGEDNAQDVVPGEMVYHTFPQINAEAKIMEILSQSGIRCAAPVKNRHNEYVSALMPGAGGEPRYAMLTSYLDEEPLGKLLPHMTDKAYLVGKSIARLHLESEKRLLQTAVKRPHKKQGYIEAIKSRFKYGYDIGALNAERLSMLNRCCGAVLGCMERMELNPEKNIGLVHTDIISGNCLYAPDQIIFVDYSRSVYSYYLYDLAQSCLHENFCGASPGLQRAIVNGYHSVIPLGKDEIYCMQALFIMFIMGLLAFVIGDGPGAWNEHVFKWFAGEVHPGLTSGKGYMNPEIFKDIL